jgi:hypothetical protein
MTMAITAGWAIIRLQGVGPGRPLLAPPDPFPLTSVTLSGITVSLQCSNECVHAVGQHRLLHASVRIAPKALHCSCSCITTMT